MEKLTIIGIDAGVISAVSDSGQLYTMELTDDVRAALKPRIAPTTSSVSPRELQALLRSGLSVAEVAERTGESVAHVERYEGPVLAELGFVLERAQAVTVQGMADGMTFREALEHKLAEQGGEIVRWQSYRLDDEWVIAISVLVGDVADEATWTFDSRKLTLHPTNTAAVRLSKANASDSSLFPPLRVVAETEPIRFDSGQFEPLPAHLSAVSPVTAPSDTGTTVIHTSGTTAEAAELPFVDPELTAPADLLEELQRRRGERANAMSSHPSTGSIPIIALDDAGNPIDPTPTAPHAARESDDSFTDSTPSRSHKRTRPNMPSWDEIVFGTRPEDD